MTTCLILGGNGFMGSHLAEALITKGYTVKVLDNFSAGPFNIEHIKNQIEIIQGDFLDAQDINKSLKNIDYVFHYVSTTIPATAKKDPVFDIKTNIIGSVKLFQLAVNNQVKRIVFSSSGGTVYGEPAQFPIHETTATSPVDPYGISKLTIEKYLYYFHKTYGLDYRILRYSNPYGERQNPFGKQGVIPIFLNKIKNGERPVIFGNGSMMRDYVYVKDAMAATIAAFEYDGNEKIFNVGSGEGKSLREIVETISKVIKKKIEVDYTEDNLKYIQKIVLDISKIVKLTGWKPTISLENGIQRTWQWINANY
jgi:UDP-glucose 4-epimerase